jgi:hypothetical protein
MGCNCKKKAEVPQPIPTPVPETPEQFHAQEMDKYAKEISEETIDWFNNIDTINPLEDE